MVPPMRVDPRPSSPPRSRALLAAALGLAFIGGPGFVGAAGCSCQRQENIDAKARLSEPPPPDPVVALAEEVIDVRGLDKDEAALKRVSRMRFAEVARRLGAVTYVSDGTFTFHRDKLAFDAKEKVTIVHTQEGDFSIALVTGDGSTQDLVYANDVLFLKNNNGKWRASRDPVGERAEYLDDSAGAWRMMFDLFAHTLELSPAEQTTWEGRSAVRYRFKVKDKSAEAVKLANEHPAVDGQGLLGADAGVATDEEIEAKKATVHERVQSWRKKARPASGTGELIVDRESGVVVKIRFDGKLLVGDASNPADLTADLSTELTQIGKPAQVSAPKAAVDEITRQKWPVAPRQVLEKAGLVGPADKPAPTDKPEPKAEGGKNADKADPAD
jgi:hypothetical protein